MTDRFEILPYSLESIGANGSGTIKIRPRGFWSETVTLYVSRGWSRNGEWRIEPGHSSGGREAVEGLTDIDAEENMAHAMLEGVKIARDLLGRIAELEAAHAAARNAERATPATTAHNPER